MDKEVVKEIIQNELNPENISKELKDILFNKIKRESIEKDYEALRNLLSEGGNASANAAKIINDLLQ